MAVVAAVVVVVAVVVAAVVAVTASVAVFVDVAVVAVVTWPHHQPPFMKVKGTMQLDRAQFSGNE